MKSVCIVVFLLAGGCSYIATLGGSTPKTQRPACGGRAVAATVDKVGAMTMASTTVGGVVVATALGGQNDVWGRLLAVGVTVPPLVAAIIYLVSSQRGNERTARCRQDQRDYDDAYALDAPRRQRAEQARIEHVRIVTACRMKRDEGFATTESLTDPSARVAALEGLPRCATIDRSERMRDLRIEATLAALRGECEAMERMVVDIRVNDSSLGLELDRSDVILACLAERGRARAERIRQQEVDRVECMRQRGIKLREANTLAPSIRARAILAIPACE